MVRPRTPRSAPDGRAWHGEHTAVCATHPDPDMWTRAQSIHDPDAITAARLCLACPLLAACRAWADDARPAGTVAAGLLWAAVGAPSLPRPAPTPGRGRASAPCGTESAYRRHRRRGETPCPACKAARAAYDRERAARTRDTQ